MGEKRGVYRGFGGETEKEDPGVDGRIILRCIFWMWCVGT
jgi:hypothetical protein